MDKKFVKKDIHEIGNNAYTAKIGWQLSMSEQIYNFGYISSFKDAADDLVESCMPDLYVYPIVFSYRQYIELSLKNICYLDLDEDKYNEFIKKSSHNLKKIWKETKKHLSGFDITKKSKIDFLDEVINDFHELDPTSFNFRYPKDKKSNLSLDGQYEINDNGTINQLVINIKNIKNNVDRYDEIIHHTYDN